MLLSLAGCRSTDTTGPAGGPPYLAVVAKVEAGALPDPDAGFRYHVTDLSEGATLDTVITLQPSDTLILSVRPATYEIKLENLPAKCLSRYGTSDVVQVPEGINTAIARFFISCNPPLGVTVFTLGGPDAFQFVWDLAGPDGSHRTGLIEKREEVVLVNPLPPGDYVFSLYNVPASCDVTSPGHRSQPVTVQPAGGAILQFTVICSQPSNRPELGTFKWSYHDSVAVFYVTAHDPDGNIVGYSFDLTDCTGRSVLPNGSIERGGLQSWHTYLQPDPVILAAIPLNLPDAQVQGRCGALRLVDDFGNTTPLVERLATGPGDFAPSVTRYNAVFAGQTRLTTALDVADPDSQYVGAFVALKLRDGVLGDSDGVPDIGVYNNQGFLAGGQIPDAEFGPSRRIQSFSDVYAQFVYLIDRQGRFRRLVDEDLFH